VELRIKGHEIFCKGGNIVAPDAFWTRVTQDGIKDMFLRYWHWKTPNPNSISFAEGENQKMLRVWGGGSYLPGWANDLADDMGILLRSDFRKWD
jgi:beta-mannosidase